MFRSEFKLNKNNYREIEYILNKYIEEQNNSHISDIEKGVFSIEVHIDHSNAISVFTFLDKIRIVEWGDGLRVFVKCKDIEHSIYYMDDKEVYSVIWFSGGGGKGDGSYVYSSITFLKATTDKY